MSLKAVRLVSLLAFVLPISAQAQTVRPNVLLVLSDDHSVPHVGAYGNPDIRTPNLDAFAKEGMRFNRAYVASKTAAVRWLRTGNQLSRRELIFLRGIREWGG